MPHRLANTTRIGNTSSNRDSATIYAETLEEQVLGEGSLVSSNNSADLLPLRMPTKHPPCYDEAEQSRLLMSRLKEAIFESVKEDTRISRDRFCVGMDAAEGREKRQEWLGIENELHVVQGLASRSVQTTSLAAQQDLFDNLIDAVVDAMRYLIDGSKLTMSHGILGDDNPFKLRARSFNGASRFPRATGYVRKQGDTSKRRNEISNVIYNVWSSADAARSAILQEAIASALRGPGRGQLLKARPLLVIALETNHRATWTNDGDRDCDLRPEQAAFLSAWTRASFGIAELITVGSGSPLKLREAIENVLQCAQARKSVVPVLTCVHAAGDSIIPCGVSSIRTVCDNFKTQLCVEGSALAMVAQPNRPSDPGECLSRSNVLLMDPGMWFGFKMSAVITRHETSTKPSILPHTNAQTREMSECSTINDDVEGEPGLSMGSVLNLWTVLSRIGLTRIRSAIDEYTTLSERFLHCFAPLANIEVLYEGVGCIILISYAMSMDDRLMTKQKVLENISAANSAIYSDLEEESRALMIQKMVVEEKTYLQFSPVRLLASGTLWIPPSKMIEDYAKKVQETVDKYEACRAGSVSFEGKAGNCRDLELVSREENGARLLLCFGAFRVVPYELCNSWRETSSAIDVVSELTKLLINELQESMDELISKSFLLQNEFEKAGVISRFTRVKAQTSWHDIPPNLQPLSTDHFSPTKGLSKDCQGLPFVIYLNSDLDAGIPDFLSVEPRKACRPVEAVRQAKLAAELLMAAIDALTCKWRGSNMISPIPRDLANVAGREDFIPLTLTREGLGCVNGLPPPRWTKPPSADSAPLSMSNGSMKENIADIGLPNTYSDSDETQFYSIKEPYHSQEDHCQAQDFVDANSVSRTRLSMQCGHIDKISSSQLHATTPYPSLPDRHGHSAAALAVAPDCSTPDPSSHFPASTPTASYYSDVGESLSTNALRSSALAPLRLAQADTLRAHEWVRARGFTNGHSAMRDGAWVNGTSYRGTSLSGSTWFGSWRSAGSQRGGGSGQERDAEDMEGRGSGDREEEDGYNGGREFDEGESGEETDGGEEYNSNEDSRGEDSGEDDSGEEESEEEEIEEVWDESSTESEEGRQDNGRGQKGLLGWLISRYTGNRDRDRGNEEGDEEVAAGVAEEQKVELGEGDARIGRRSEEEVDSDCRNGGTDLSEAASDWSCTRGGWDGTGMEEEDDVEEEKEEEISGEESMGEQEEDRGEEEGRGGMSARFGLVWLRRLMGTGGTVQEGAGEEKGCCEEGEGVRVMEKGVSAGGIYAGSMSSFRSEVDSGESVVAGESDEESEESVTGDDSEVESEESVDESEEVEGERAHESEESIDSRESEESDGYTDSGYSEVVVMEDLEEEEEEYDSEVEVEIESEGMTTESYDTEVNGESEESTEGTESTESAEDEWSEGEFEGGRRGAEKGGEYRRFGYLRRLFGGWRAS